MALLLAGAVGSADVGQVYGNTDDPVCSGTVARLTEANSNLYAFHSGLITDADDIILDTKGGLFKRGGPAWSNGLWFLLRNNEGPRPRGRRPGHDEGPTRISDPCRASVDSSTGLSASCGDPEESLQADRRRHTPATHL